MEVLAEQTFNDYSLIILFAGFTGLCLILMGMIIDTCKPAGIVFAIGAGIFCILFIVSLTGVFNGPPKVEYTVEVKSMESYQWLIENNYKIIKRLYETKNIYEIKGAPLPNLDWIIPLDRPLF